MAKSTISPALRAAIDRVPFKRIPAAAGRTRACNNQELTQLWSRIMRLVAAGTLRAKGRRVMKRFFEHMPDAKRAAILQVMRAPMALS
jgi:hypothetical protein